jgi:hypothetical protein
MVEFYPACCRFYIRLALNQEALRRLLGSRFDDWSEFSGRLNYVCLFLPNVKE